MSIDFVENYKSLSNEEVVDLINKGNFELFQVITARYLSRIMYYVDRFCAENEREDAVQEATYALYSAVKNFEKDKSSFSTFASLCIKRSVIARVKHSKSQRIIPNELVSPIDGIEIADHNSPEKIVIAKEEYKALTESIKLELSGLEYKVLQLFLAGKKYAEIANILSISEKSVNNALLRIRKKLKDK